MSWSFPGARWWKFDFHTHTPASKDTDAWQNAIGTEEEVTPELWLQKYMAAEIDCVAVTDHNSGDWIDRLKQAYQHMKAQVDAGEVVEGFRELTLFPGVEISVSGGIHLLAIFDPEATTRTVTDLLARVGYQGTDGDSDGVTTDSIETVIEKVLAAGGIPIPAHADQKNGLLQCNGESAASALNASTIRQALAVDGLLAVEWCDQENQFPESVRKEESRLAKVLGSDCHTFQGNAVPGSRYTWVKMASPTLEGLRLALLDGNGVSIRRSDCTRGFEPFKVPEHLITGLEISNARSMGRGRAAQLRLSPFFNAIVGGRGTGKSTIVHAIRLAAQREQEVLSLSEHAEPRAQFKSFIAQSNARNGKGALRDDTQIRLEWRYGERDYRLVWQADGQAVQVEELHDGQWALASSQSITPARFPVRIFSQGQIAAIAGSGRKSLLSIIDESAQIDALQVELDEARRTFFALQARLREMDGKLLGEAEAQRKLDDVTRKQAALAQTDQASVLKQYAQSQQQQREVQRTFDQLLEQVEVMRNTAENLLLDDWPAQMFSEQDADLLALRTLLDQQLSQSRSVLMAQANQLAEWLPRFQQDDRYLAWQGRTDQALHAYQDLQKQLAAQGVSDPHAFARLTQEKQQLDLQCKGFAQLRLDRQALVGQIKNQQQLLLEKRKAITEKRKEFINEKLANNLHVRMQVVPFGYDSRQIERELRQLLDIQDERFADDILASKKGEEPDTGLAWSLAAGVNSSQDADGFKEVVLESMKTRLIQTQDGLSGHFRNYLLRKLEKPEFADHVLAWFPEDDLRIEYQRGDQWHPIHQGSQGQRSAALLAFLLAFGDEPIILDQPEDDLDNQLIYDLIVQQIRENKLRRQLIVITHNPNVVVNGDAELVHVMAFGNGQCLVQHSGALQEKAVRQEVCRVMEGGHEAFAKRWKRLGTEV